jgi:hypothetical protein
LSPKVRVRARAPRIPSIPFTRDKLEKLLVDLLKFLKNSGFDFR